MFVKDLPASAMAATLALVLTTSASAATLNIVQNNGTTYQTGSVMDHQNGFTMTGMQVTITYIASDGSLFVNQPHMWEPHVTPNDDVGEVVWGGNDIVVRAFGETSNDGAWTFSASGLFPQGERIFSIAFNSTLDGSHDFGFTAFDRSFGGNAGTVGSGAGRDFSGFDGYNGMVTGIYSDAVALGPNAPVGDLFLRFTLQFGDGTFANALQSAGVTFSLDTDRIGSVTAVPEPASLILLGTGLAGFVSRLRRKRSPWREFTTLSDGTARL